MDAQAGNRLQRLRIDVELTARCHKAPSEIAEALERRLRALPYVLQADWAREAVRDADERLLPGTVVMLPMEELPDGDPDLDSYYACFKLPGVLGPNGPAPQTVAQQTRFMVEEMEREERYGRLRAELEAADRAQRDFIAAEPILEPGVQPAPGLTPADFELSLVLNVLCEAIDWEAYRTVHGQYPIGKDFAFKEAFAAGLRDALRIIGNEMSERALRYVAAGAPWMQSEEGSG